MANTRKPNDETSKDFSKLASAMKSAGSQLPGRSTYGRLLPFFCRQSHQIQLVLKQQANHFVA